MTAMPIHVHLPDRIAAEVRRIAALEQRGVDETIRRLTEEALVMRAFPEIVFTDGPTGRRATFINGPDVWEVVEPYLLAGNDWQALRDSYPQLDEEMLRTAIRYHAAYPEEIEARIERNNAEPPDEAHSAPTGG
jgi:uncharacterized protein (DUF433 family)